MSRFIILTLADNKLLACRPYSVPYYTYTEKHHLTAPEYR